MTITKTGASYPTAGVDAKKIQTDVYNFVVQHYGLKGNQIKLLLDAITAAASKTEANSDDFIKNVEEMRQTSLQGENTDDATAINNFYDQALAYFSLRQEILTAQKKDQAYTWPDIEAKLSDNGAWRKKADAANAELKKEQIALKKAAEKQQKADVAADRKAYIDSLSPIDAALAETPESALKEKVKPLLTAAIRGAYDQGLLPTNPEIVQNIRQQISILNVTTQEKGYAYSILNRASTIARSRGQNTSILDIPLGLGYAQASADSVIPKLVPAYDRAYDISNYTPAQLRELVRAFVLNANTGNAEIKKIDAILAKYTNTPLDNNQWTELANATDSPELTQATAILMLEEEFNKIESKKIKVNEAGLREIINTEAPKYLGYLRRAATPAAAPAAADPAAAAPAPADSAADSATDDKRNGVRAYGKKDGTRAPNLGDIPLFSNDEQVKALQKALGVKVDGMYGPDTHAAMIKALQDLNASKNNPNEYNFKNDDELDAFITVLNSTKNTAAAQSQSQSSTAAEVPTPAATPPLAELKAELTKIANSLSDRTSQPISVPVLINVNSTQQVVQNIKQKLKDAGVTETEILDAVVSTLTVDSNGHIHSSLIQKIEELAGFAGADDTLDARSAALLDPNTDAGRQAIPRIAKAINSGVIKAR